MTALLVSVRSVEEAEAALAGAAAVSDIKEPANGALGRATECRIAEIVRVVAGRRPVSVALGEWCDTEGEGTRVEDLSYFKWGFAGLNRPYPAALDRVSATLDRVRRTRPGCGLVTVAYVDWKRAHAPEPADLCNFACAGRWGPLLLDTWGKDGTTLLDHLPLAQITALVGRCRAAGIAVALAGSLGQEQMQVLLPLRPDWFAVRGAVCRGGRLGSVDGRTVRDIVDWLADGGSAP